jgi:hypothetical protein
MARTCPNCGRQAIDDQSQFCNKCGTPFPADQPKKVLVRTTPRLAETQPAPPVQQYREEPPATERYTPPVPPARSLADPPRVRAPAKQPVQRQQIRSTPLPFGKLYAKRFIRLFYWIGLIAILMIVVAGVTTGTTKSVKTAGEATNTTAEGSGDLLADIPLFWIGVLIFGALFWRTVCEIAAVQFALYDSQTAPQAGRGMDQDTRYGEEDFGGAPGEDMVTCPRCGKVVPASELRSCSHCGVEGCSSCIRMMGLIKKTLTCRDCYQK